MVYDVWLMIYGLGLMVHAVAFEADFDQKYGRNGDYLLARDKIFSRKIEEHCLRRPLCGRDFGTGPLQGYLAHNKHPPPLRPIWGPRLSPTVGS